MGRLLNSPQELCTSLIGQALEMHQKTQNQGSWGEGKRDRRERKRGGMREGRRERRGREKGGRKRRKGREEEEGGKEGRRGEGKRGEGRERMRKEGGRMGETEKRGGGTFCKCTSAYMINHTD